MIEKKAEEGAVQAQLDRIQVILNGNEYKGPFDKMRAIKVCVDTGYKIIYGNVPGESHEAKD